MKIILYFDSQNTLLDALNKKCKYTNCPVFDNSKKKEAEDSKGQKEEPEGDKERLTKNHS